MGKRLDVIGKKFNLLTIIRDIAPKVVKRDTTGRMREQKKQQTQFFTQ